MTRVGEGKETMNGILKVVAPIIGIGAACAACCAAPLLGAGLAGLGLGGIGAAWFDWRVGVALLAAAGLGMAALRLATRHAPGCLSPVCAGGCKTACAVPERQA